MGLAKERNRLDLIGFYNKGLNIVPCLALAPKRVSHAASVPGQMAT